MSRNAGSDVLNFAARMLKSLMLVIPVVVEIALRKRAGQIEPRGQNAEIINVDGPIAIGVAGEDEELQRRSCQKLRGRIDR